MVDQIIVNGIIFVGIAFIGVLVLVFWLWRRKTLSDRKAYSDVLDKKSVNTFYSPQDYAKAAKEKKNK